MTSVRVLPRTAAQQLSLALLLLALAQSAGAVSEKSSTASTEAGTDYDAVYESVFGHAPSSQSHRVSADLVVDGRRSARVIVQVPIHGPGLRIQAAPLLGVMEEILLDPALVELRARVDGRGELSLQDLRALGYDVSHRARRQTLSISPPAKARRVRIVSVSGAGAPRLAGSLLRPARLSGFLNLRSSASFRDDEDTFTQGFETSNNYRGFVLGSESRLDHDEEDTEFDLDRIRGHRDLADAGLRLEAGSLAPPTFGPQESQELVGIGVTHISALDFYERPAPMIEDTLELDGESTIDVWINGERRRSLELAAGRYQLRDFPLDPGINTVHLQIKRDGEIQGRVQTVVWERDVLRPGEQQMSLNLGTPSSLGRFDRPGEDAEPVFLGFYRRGITREISAGPYLDGNHIRQGGGLTSSYASPFGLMSAGTGISHYRDEGADTAVQIGLRNYTSRSRLGPVASYGVGMRYQTARFGQQREREGQRPRELRTDGFLGVQITNLHSANLRGFVQTNRGARTGGGVGLFFLHRVVRDFTLQWGGGWRRTQSDPSEWDAGLRITWQPQRSRIRSAFTYSAEDSRVGLEWSQPTWRFDDLRVGVDYDDSDEFGAAGSAVYGDWRAQIRSGRTRGASRVGGRLAYTGPQALLLADIDDRGRVDEFLDSQRLARLDAGTAVVFADGQFALSRPVQNSFVILRPRPGLGRARIRFSPDAEAGLLGPGVVSSLRPWRDNAVRVIDADLPLGATVLQRAVLLRPEDATGYLVDIGEGGGMLVEGVLVDADGQRIGLASGRVEILEAADGTPGLSAEQPFFTNREGEFTLVEMRPGRFRLVLSRPGPGEATLVIPETPSTLHDAGILEVLREESR